MEICTCRGWGASLGNSGDSASFLHGLKGSELRASCLHKPFVNGTIFSVTFDSLCSSDVCFVSLLHLYQNCMWTRVGEIVKTDKSGITPVKVLQSRRLQVTICPKLVIQMLFKSVFVFQTMFLATYQNPKYLVGPTESIFEDLRWFIQWNS